MSDKRSPLSRLIDAVCGIPNGMPKMPLVTLKCKKCKARKRVPMHETDPKGTATVMALCPKCNPGDFDEPYYLDAAGKEIIWKPDNS